MLRYILYGLAYVLVPEFTNLVVINRIPAALPGCLLIYAILLAAGYGIQKLLGRLLHDVIALNLLCILLFGSLGLLLEWVVIGNSPWQNPDAIQWGMFVYWAGLFMLPRILVDGREPVKPLARKIRRVYLVYSALHLAIALLVPAAILPAIIGLLWTTVHTGFFVFYVQYMSRLHGQYRGYKSSLPGQPLAHSR